MKPNLATGSLLFFGLSLLLLLALSTFESAFLNVSISVERVITVLFLVVPAVIGGVLGATSLARREGHTWMAIIGIILNALFGLFFLLLTFFAG